MVIRVIRKTIKMCAGFFRICVWTFRVSQRMVLVQCSWLNSNSKFLIPNHWALLCNHWRKILKWNLQDSAYHVVGTKCMNTIEHKHSVSGQQRGGYGVVVSDCQDCLCNANAGEPSSESSSPSLLCDDFAATFPPCHLIGKWEARFSIIRKQPPILKWCLSPTISEPTREGASGTMLGIEDGVRY